MENDSYLSSDGDDSTITSKDGGSRTIVANVIQSGLEEQKPGMGYLKTSYFLIATMVGAGFLALPRALADAGWLGIALLIIFCGSIGFAATRLGKCWHILEERWPKYRLPARQPYMDIAEKAFGKIGRNLCFGCVIFTLIGYGIAFIILISDMMNSLVPQLSICHWMVIVTILVWPATFFGTPKDFWQASVLAVVATLVTIVVILVQLGLDVDKHPNPQYPNPTVSSFALGFSGILFAFGGVSVFPTLQNDMHTKTDWWKTVIIGFTFVLSLYLPIAITGYVVIGNEVSSNILLDASDGVIVTIAIALDIVNLLATYVICFNPVGQAFEDVLHVPQRFSWKRMVLRSCIVLFEFVISLAIPDFGSILNLIGGSTIAILSFIFPPLMYIWLVDMKKDDTWDNKASEKTMELWERVYLWLIVVVAVMGSITSTVVALLAILNPDSFGESCFSNFLLTHNEE